MSSPVHCPLCLSPRHHALPVAGKGYYRCLACELVWMDEADHLDEGYLFTRTGLTASVLPGWDNLSSRCTP